MNYWTAFTDEWPKPNQQLLVTNNLESLDAHGVKSHVWLTTFPLKSSEHDGEIVCFDEADRKIRFLSHWRYALPEEVK